MSVPGTLTFEPVLEVVVEDVLELEPEPELELELELNVLVLIELLDGVVELEVVVDVGRLPKYTTAPATAMITIMTTTIATSTTLLSACLIWIFEENGYLFWNTKL